MLHGVTFPPKHSAFFGNDEFVCGDRNAFTVCRPDIIGRFQCFQQFGVIPGLDHEIGRLVEAVVDSDSFGGDYTLADVYECDRMARAFVQAHL